MKIPFQYIGMISAKMLLAFHSDERIRTFKLILVCYYIQTERTQYAAETQPKIYSHSV